MAWWSRTSMDFLFIPLPTHIFRHTNQQHITQIFRFVFGLSDATVGPTIFAMGNSLTDLVRNLNVAVSLFPLLPPSYHLTPSLQVST
ncbi:hypothetical protein DEU56DRAFT_798717 [Suillus clintonianus]|uniref:uncharacterized protein n=1 Tax=Suillus clintonianus TaxID=1904413 RepID=UPI001B868770|nr:uncharacterized protein DEU56DRAFT_798717 [Suillus clintonianus]KAG2140121.1 hypothetical protein DEU56DRAFT_798717 [Suillus clintonianus]